MRPPPLREKGSLPRYITSFVGREKEITEITDLLMRDDVRLLVLTGPGGAGKTRLAVEAVDRLRDDSWDDIWFVSLVGLKDPALVLPAIAQALGLHQITGRPVIEAVTHFLGDRRALLVIDNFELVTPAAPDLGRILAACPNVTMLVTSRVTLQISAEHLMVVQPLTRPGPHTIPLDQLRDIESVQLFLQRARAVNRAFVLTPENASSISRICHHLDGLPLALELAAARCVLLSPAALEALLEHGTSLLSDGPRDAPERHRSMHDTIAWSYNLLPAHEQAVFRQLAVFNGGFSLEAAEGVLDVPVDVLRVIASLVRQSLIFPAQADGSQPRFTMLETLREFGLEQLAAADEEKQVRDRHASYFLREAIEGEYAWCMFAEDGLRWLKRLKADQANFRDALAWLEQNAELRTCLRMAGALGPLWVDCGNLNEGQQWLDRLLAGSRAVDGPERANALATLSWVSNQQGRMARAFALAEECLALTDPTATPIDHVRCHILSGVAAATMDQYDLAVERLEGAVAHLETREEPPWIGNLMQIALAQLGLVELMQGRIDSAEARFKARYDNDIGRGFDPGTSSLYSNQVFNELGLIALARGRPADALGLLQHNLRLTLRYSSVNFSIVAISDIAEVLASLGSLEPAARLFGASETLHATYGLDFSFYLDSQRALGLPGPSAQGATAGNPLHVSRTVLRPRLTSQMPRTMTAEALAAAWDAGRRLSLEEAATEALAATPNDESVPGTPPVHGLSARETDVLRLLAEGRSNRAIAENLSLSERTVEHHVTHILAKLGLDSRTSAATFAIRNGLT